MLAFLASIAAKIAAVATAVVTKVVTVAKSAVAAAKTYVAVTAPAKIVSDAVKITAITAPIILLAKAMVGKVKIAKIVGKNKKLASDESPFDRAMKVNRRESAIGYNNEAEKISDSILRKINKPFEKSLTKKKIKGGKKFKKLQKSEEEWREIRHALNRMINDPDCKLAQDALKEYVRTQAKKKSPNRRFAWYDDEIDDTHFKGIDFEEILDVNDQTLMNLIDNDGSWELVADEDGYPAYLKHEQVQKYARDREEMSEVCKNYPNLEAGGFWDDNFGKYWSTSTYLVDLFHNPISFPG